MKCCICQKEIKDKDHFIGSSYGDLCSDKCWRELASNIVGYDPGVRDIDEERRLKEESERRRQELRSDPFPKWGDDL